MWLKECHKAKGFWNDFEHCNAAYSLCGTMSEFIQKYRTAYNSCKQNNWLGCLKH